MSQVLTLKGWLVVVKDDERFDCVVAARSVGQAKATCWKAGREAGYNFDWGDFRVKRKPEADIWAVGCGEPSIVSTSHFSAHCLVAPLQDRPA